MKRFVKNIFVVCFIFLATFVYAENLKILSFNLNSVPKVHRLENNQQWADNVICIFKESKADIILLQEVCIDLKKRNDTKLFKNPAKNNVLDYFVKNLNDEKASWQYFTSAPYMLRKTLEKDGVEYSSGDKTQNNAVLYNATKLVATDLAESLKFTNFDGKYLFNKNSVQVIEFGVPEVARKLIVVNVHLPYLDYKKRINDILTLERLYASYKMKNAVIIGGDFNFSREYLTRRNFDNVDGTTGWYYDLFFGLCTTLSKNDECIYFANDYDHFIFNKFVVEKEKTARLNIPTKDVKLDSVQLGNETFYNSASFRELLSDHYPIVFKFEIFE